MRIRLVCVVVLVAAVSVLSVEVAGAARAGGAWVSFTDASVGIRVSIPHGWHTVPPTVAGVRALVGKLERENSVPLARVYASFVSTPAAQAQMLRYLFQAFEYSPSATQQPDFALAYARTTKAANLATTADSVAKSYAG
ncbi:MAG: hypothetical protein ACREJM_05350, partial [Candidatus Saccharimonadales bacterium]